MFLEGLRSSPGFRQMETLKKDLLVAESCVDRACSFPPLETDSPREALSSSLPAPKDFSFLGPTLTKPQFLFPCSLSHKPDKPDFQREINFKNKGNQKENTPRKKKKPKQKNPTKAYIHMNKKQERKQNKIK